MKVNKALFVLVAALLVSCADASSSSSSFSSSEGISSETSSFLDSASSSETGMTYVKKDIPIYDGSETSTGPLTTYFLNGVNNIPYVLAYDVLYANIPDGFDLTDGDGVLTYANMQTGDKMVMNYEANTITYSDYYALFGNVDTPCFLCSYVYEDSFRQRQVSYSREADSTKRVISLSDYHIQMALCDEGILLPVSTAYDLFDFYNHISYNGYAYFINEGVYDKNKNLTEHGAFYKEVPSSFVYDETLRSFTYNELCLSLDFFYGMKDLRNYGSFDSLFIEEGLKTKFFAGNPDASKVEGWLNEVFNVLLNDNGHTYISTDGSSLFRESEIRNDELSYSEAQIESYDVYDAIARKKEKLGIDEPFFVEGDTVFLNFENFTWFEERDEESKWITDDESSCGLIKQANDYIQSHDSEIQNVVINLTTNGGGMDVAELYTSSWISGKAYQHTVGPCANFVKEVGEYVADVNMDGQYDDKDNIADKKIYLLTSRYTFSNGNVLPGELKGSANVKIIGQKTGGGSCNTITFMTAIGNLYNSSALTRAANANWESMELGVEPDILLEDPLATCDYEALLANYIHQ